MDESYLIPRRLDDPPMLAMFDADEAAAFLVPVVTGFMVIKTAVAVVLGVVFGIALARMLSRLKSEGGPGFGKQLMYWYLPAEYSVRLRHTPPSHLREFVG